METETIATDKFETILDAERQVQMLDIQRQNGDTADERVNALQEWKTAKRRLYRLIDELEPDQIREYGHWRQGR